MTDMKSKERLVTAADLAEIADISESTIWRLKGEGKIPYVQPGGKGHAVRFPADALEQAGEFQPMKFIGKENASDAKQFPGPKPTWMKAGS